MSQLSVNFCGLEMNNPIIIASSPATESLKGIIKCAKAGAGAIITKSIADYNTSTLMQGKRRTYVGPSVFWATSTFQRETLARQEGIDLISEASCRVDMPIIASVAAPNLDLDYWLPTCLDLQAAGANMIQLDLFYLPQPICDKKYLTKLLILFEIITKKLSIPVIPKLNIELPAYFVANYFPSTSSHKFRYSIWHLKILPIII